MRKSISIIIGMSLFLVFSVSFLQASELVGIDAAKRAAVYHGELIFEKNLEVCEHQLLYWPWGEPAVYVFTLMEEGDYYPEPILLDSPLIAGAYLVSEGKETEGYILMAQADRYMTAVVGATTDMPSFLKAHAGLPEHVLALAVLQYPPLEPRWVYGGLFHTLLTTEKDMITAEGQAIEIHLGRKVFLKDLGFDKTGTIPDYAVEQEWDPFLRAAEAKKNEESSYLIDVAKVKKGKHMLNVAENAFAVEEGCSPAAFVNCLKYLEDERKIVNTGNKSIEELLEWTAICYRTDPYKGRTEASWIVEGSKIMFRGLGYDPAVSAHERSSKPGLFLTQFAEEINNKYPCNLGSGKGIFEEHSTCGIGYWKQGKHVRLIIHDGWVSTPGQPVYVKYQGYPADELEFPKYLRRFHPQGKKFFEKAIPKFKNPKELIELKAKRSKWKWKDIITSQNGVKVEAYKAEYIFRDTKGKKYRQVGKTTKRVIPYITNVVIRWCLISRYKRGEVLVKWNLIDENGHLLIAEHTVRLEHILGEWDMTITWTGYDPFPTTWTFTPDGRFVSGTSNNGTWTLKNKKVEVKYETGQKPIYSGKITDDKYSKISGTAQTTIPDQRGKHMSGTYEAIRKSDIYSSLSGINRATKPKTSTPLSDAAIESARIQIKKK